MQRRPKRDPFPPWSPPMTLSPLMVQLEEALAAPAPETFQEPEAPKRASVQAMPAELQSGNKRLESCQVMPCFGPGDKCMECSGVVEIGAFKSITAELEFSVWGLCQACQDKLFLFHSSPGKLLQKHSEDIIMIAPSHPFAALSPYHVVPVAYPEHTVWKSPFHLFLALQFQDEHGQRHLHDVTEEKSSVRGLQGLARDTQLQGCQVREEWHMGWAVKAMRHAMFLALEQHPSLAKLLLATGTAKIVFVSENLAWGVEVLDSGMQRGENLIGKFLEEKRRRLT